MPTKEQLNNRLNPTPVTVSIPTEGLFRATNDFGSVLYKRNPDGTVTKLDLLDAKNGLYANGTSGAGIQAQQALNTLKTKYGIDFNALPAYNLGDLESSGGITGFVYDPYGQHDATNAQALKTGTINDFVGSAPSSGNTSTTLNGPGTVDPNSVVPQGTTPKDPNQSTNPQSSPQVQGATGVQPPTMSLQPGATGEAVKQLQDYLVSQGVMTQDQVNSGYGTYGPQTTAAVAALQQKLGVENSSGVGYWGPKTMSAVSTASGTSTGSSTANTNTTSSAPSGTGLTFNTNYGVTQDQWNQMNDVQRATVSAAYTAKQAAYNTSGQALTFADALTQAAQDPNIVAQYADAAKLDAQVFQQNLAQIQQTQTSTAQTMQQQFENDRKSLSEQQAANGTAYSGFRGQAQKQLGTAESGIVQSSRSALQKQLNDATSQFEAKYGTGATTPATANFQDPYASSNISLSGQYSPSGTQANTLLTGTTAGNITGTQPIAKQNAINSKATDLYNLANVTPSLA